ncbi:MAG: uroporphyrinogen decarboxylase [Clostridiales bacterium]|jgi:uroporphyrinogen decarboxylase|nr:uroporphyrinogen decarboxylase [Clostridiales bacterium]
MNSKEMVLAAVRNQETERAPWVPFVGCHAAKLIGVNADEYFKSADLIVKGMETAVERYRPDGIPALFDLQIEAEAMGCQLQWAKSNPPAVSSHPLEGGAMSVSELKIPTENDGRFPIVLDAMRRICQGVGQEKAVYGLITGPFTLALHLMGTDIFYNMIDEPELVHELMRFATKVGIETSRMYLEAGCDIIAVVDPMTSQISPDNFSDFVTPYMTEIFDYVRSQDKLGTLFVCGNAKNNIEEMCKCHAHGLSIDENIPLDYVRDMCRKYDISFGGNIKLTVTMLFGTPTDNVNDAMNCMAIGGTKGFVLAPGCDMPFDVPPENVEAVSALVHGEIADFMESSNPLEGVEVELPDYSDKSKVYIDIITLDSESCAPCQYMMEAVYAASRKLGDAIVYKEHKIKDKAGVVAMMKLGVSNVPTIVIDGKISFISIIPDESTFMQVLKDAMQAKGLET